MGNKIISQATWIMILVVIVSKRGKAIVDIKPTDTLVLLKGSTFFNCSTFNFTSSSEEIAWYHYSVSSNQRRDVYEDGEIRTNYERRFRVEKDLSKGVVNLIVQAPTLEDAGTYECQDGKGIGETARAQLIVLETEPVCQYNIQPDGVVGSNDCGIHPDQVEMLCGVAYRGNNPVHLEWRNGLVNDNSTLTVECSNTTNRSTCNLTVTGDRTKDNSAYICQTKNTGTNAFSCSSDVIKILYVISDNTTISKTDLDEYRCSANSSQQCTYTWFSGDGTIVSPSESLKPARSGQYFCKANCSIRGQACLVIARNLKVSVETTTGETGKTPVIAGVVVSFFVITAAIICVFVVLHRYKKHKNKQKKNHNDDKEEKSSLQNRMNEDGSDPAPPDVDDSVLSAESVIQEAFQANDYLGKGLSGEIYGPGHYKDNECACEKIMFFRDELTPANEGQMTKEGKICNKGRQWMTLDHDNLIKFYDVVLRPPAVYIVMEFAAGGDVRKALNTYTEDLPTEVVIDWATQIAKGMEYLHEKCIVHKGLKCAQILIMERFDTSTSARVTLKVASYSLAYEINTSNPVTFKGMFAWMAPEAISEENHSNYSDIWSYGVTIWEILTRGIPYNDNKVGKIIKGIPSGKLFLKIPASCPKVLRDIFNECFDLEPTRRPAFSTILTSLRGGLGV